MLICKIVDFGISLVCSATTDSELDSLLTNSFDKLECVNQCMYTTD